MDGQGELINMYKPHGMSLWKKINMESQKNFDFTKWKVGKGDKIRFWLDDWMDVDRLKDQFPNICAFNISRNMVVVEAYEEVSGKGNGS